MFKYLSEFPSCEKFYESYLFPPATLVTRYTIHICTCTLVLYSLYYNVNYNSESGTLEDVKNWLKTLPTHDKDLTKCGSDTLNERHIAEIDNALKAIKVLLYTYSTCTST